MPLLPGSARFLSGYLDLLKENNLPWEDIPADFTFFIWFDGDTPAGFAGVEFYSKDCLLRSVVVKDKGKGTGTLLVSSVLEELKNRSFNSVFLFTETASRFFSGIGFTETSRQKVTGPLKKSTQFTGSCPATATFMEFRIQ